jgi:PAS domain S-box-containing protein
LTHPTPDHATHRYTILIADDLEENIDLVEDILGDSRYMFVRARNGLESLEALSTTQVHLIIADAMMPKMDGFELCKAIRLRHSSPRIPFVIHTANYVDKEDEEFARRIGVDRYLMKQPGLESLIETVDELLGNDSGHRKTDPGAPPPDVHHLDDPSFLERHHRLVSKKLEEKMAELELYTRTLNLRNRELQSSEARYKSLFIYASVAIFVLDRNSGRIVDANNAAMVLLKSTKEDLLALESFPFAEGNEHVLSLQDSTGYASADAAIRTKEGETIEVEIAAGPVVQPYDDRLILYVRDVTEQRHMRQQLIEAEKMMMMGSIAAGIAHEIRNPLTGVALNLQFLLMKEFADPSLRTYVEAANEGTQRIGSVVESTLSLARRAPLTLRPEPVNAVAIQALRLVRIPLREKRITLTMDLAESLPPVAMDVREIQQALINLLQNAIEVSPPGSTITVTSSLLPSFLIGAPAPGVEIAIADAGPGIRPEDLPRMFEPLRSTKSGGSGIGLALSKHIMERHGGRIALEPRPGGGTKASLVFNTLTKRKGEHHV